MDASKISWCKNQKQGIEITEPNENLAKEYLKSANETLELLRIVSGRSNMWAATMKYYFEYFLAYALLRRIGIKSGIHDCTVEVIKWLEKEGVINDLGKILEKDKQLRIDNQYYLKNIKEDINFDRLTELYLYVKDTIGNMDDQKTESLIKKFRVKIFS